MLITHEIQQEYIELARPKYGVKIVEKKTSKFMKAIAAVLFFNKSFLTGYITTIGTTIYWPDADSLDSGGSRFSTLFHEIQHAADFKKHPVFFVLSYLSPQVLSIFALMTFLSIWFGDWWAFSLLALLCLLPLPSPRAIWEMRASSCAMALRAWGVIKGGSESEQDEFFIKRFTGPDYYFMCPFKSVVVWLANRYRKRIESGNLTETQRWTYTFLERHNIVGGSHGTR